MKMKKATRKVLIEASKLAAEISEELNPDEYRHSEAGFKDLIERLEHVKNLIIMAKMFEFDLD